MVENKKKIKVIVISIIVFIIFMIVLFGTVYTNVKKNREDRLKNLNYQKIICNETQLSNYTDRIISDYNDYKNLIDYYSHLKSDLRDGIFSVKGNDLYYSEDVFEKSNLLVIFIKNIGCPFFETNIVSFNEKKDTVNVKISYNGGGDTVDRNEHVFIIPISKNITSFNIGAPYDYEELIIRILEILITSIYVIAIIVLTIGIIKNKKEKIKKKRYILGLVVLILSGIVFSIGLMAYNDAKQIAMEKPIIYLYPTKETRLSVKLGNKDNITCSYPNYIDGWNVMAKTNGDLKDLGTGRNLYSLYIEMGLLLLNGEEQK